MLTNEKLLEDLLSRPIYGNIVKLFLNQQRKGLSKYGELMSIKNWTLEQCIDHAQQECIDTLVYLESIKESIKLGGN